MKTRPSIALLLALLCADLPAAQTLPWGHRTDGPEVHAAFEAVREELQACSAVIRDGRDEIQYATVVSPDGYLLTKASELADAGKLTIIVDREVFDEWELVAEDPIWDLALIRVEASGLSPVRFGELVEPEQGEWVVANGATTRSRRRVQVGVISATSREVFPKGGTVLGVQLEEVEGGPRVIEVTEGSGAERAGLRAGDVLRKVEGGEVHSIGELQSALSRRQAGTSVAVTVERDGHPLELSVELSERGDLFEIEPDRNDAMSGEYSERRSGFPRVIQHDIIGNRHSTGGPLLNLDGDCVGLNIARFNRCESYAIPAAELRGLIDSMIASAGSGR